MASPTVSAASAAPSTASFASTSCSAGSVPSSSESSLSSLRDSILTVFSDRSFVSSILLRLDANKRLDSLSSLYSEVLSAVSGLSPSRFFARASASFWSTTISPDFDIRFSDSWPTPALRALEPVYADFNPSLSEPEPEDTAAAPLYRVFAPLSSLLIPLLRVFVPVYAEDIPSFNATEPSYADPAPSLSFFAPL